MKISIASNFSKFPGPRYIKEGDNSGQKFRDEFLLPKVKEAIVRKEKIFIDLDGTNGYGTSFLEETFGGLIRVHEFKYDVISKIFEFKSDEEPYLIEDIKSYMLAAKDAAE